MKEEVVLLGANQTLVAVITEPEQPQTPDLPAVVLFNAGLTHRIGPNRIYVRLARHLAALGMVVVRFDLSGVGDSSARRDNATLEAGIIDDARQVMDFLSRTRGSQRYFLMGHCGGALTSLGIASIDPRAIGVVMINAEGGDTEWDEYDQKRKNSNFYENYYRQDALVDSKRWVKFLTGKADYLSIYRNVFITIIWHRIVTTVFKIQKKLFANQESQTRPEIAALYAQIPSLIERSTSVLIIYSQGSSGLERTELLLRDVRKKIGNSPGFKVEVMPNSDHTFTLVESQQRLYKIIADWCLTNVSMPSMSMPSMSRSSVSVSSVSVSTMSRPSISMSSEAAVAK